MGVKQRYQEADYLDVGTEAEKYAFMGTGFTKIDDSPAAQTTSKRYPPKGLAYHSFHDTAENIICSLVKANATNATDTKRNIPFLKVKASSGRGDRVYYQTRYDNLDEAVTALCEASGLGVSVSLIPENQQLLFEVLEGVDRSANQSNRPPMIFNVDYDNVTNREFISDISEYKNTAIVAGQGEGAERRIRYVGNENSGLERYELFVDARDIEDDTALPDRGKSKLAECACNDTYSSEVDSSQYKIKWDIGDIVVTVDREYAVNMNERIVETTETFDENGYSISPTFGTTQKTILEKLSAISASANLVDSSEKNILSLLTQVRDALKDGDVNKAINLLDSFILDSGELA